MQRAARLIIIGQVLLYSGIVVCVVLQPDGLTSNSGISYYGIYAKTVVPYAIGLLGSAACSVIAIRYIQNQHYKLIRQALLIYAVLTAGIVLTPYSWGRVFDDLHTACGSLLFSLQLVLSGWLIVRLRYEWLSVLLGLTELVAGILSAAYLSPTNGYLIQSQLVFQLAFGLLLIRGLHRLTATQPDTIAS